MERLIVTLYSSTDGGNTWANSGTVLTINESQGYFYTDRSSFAYNTTTGQPLIAIYSTRNNFEAYDWSIRGVFEATGQWSPDTYTDAEMTGIEYFNGSSWSRINGPWDSSEGEAEQIYSMHFIDVNGTPKLLCTGSAVGISNARLRILTPGSSSWEMTTYDIPPYISEVYYNSTDGLYYLVAHYSNHEYPHLYTWNETTKVLTTVKIFTTLGQVTVWDCGINNNYVVLQCGSLIYAYDIANDYFYDYIQAGYDAVIAVTSKYIFRIYFGVGAHQIRVDYGKFADIPEGRQLTYQEKVDFFTEWYLPYGNNVRGYATQPDNEGDSIGYDETILTNSFNVASSSKVVFSALRLTGTLNASDVTTGPADIMLCDVTVGLGTAEAGPHNTTAFKTNNKYGTG